MAITQISRVKARTGEYADLPVLAPGELGYATDEKRLFIGNPGSTLPSGNTEILTTANYSGFSGSGASGFSGKSGYSGAPGGVTQLIAGTNVTLSPPTGLGTVTINATGGGGGTSGFSGVSGFSGSGGSITVKDEGTTLTTSVTSIDFVGAGVTSTNVGSAVTVTIPGGGGGGATYPPAGVPVSTGAAWSSSLTAPSSDLVGISDTQTLTNKRVTLRYNYIVSSSSITPNSDTTDVYSVRALALGANVNIPSGTPTNGQRLIMRFKDNGVARSLSWNTGAGGYRVIGTILPTSTIAGKWLYVGCIYNSDDATPYWDVIAVTTEL